MKTIIALLFLAVFVPITLQATTKEDVLKTLRGCGNFPIGYSITSGDIGENYTEKELNQKIKAEPENPTWLFIFTTLYQKNDSADAKINLRKVCDLFSEKAKKNTLTGLEIANWSQTKATIDGIELGDIIALNYLNNKPENAEPVYKYLSQSFTQKAVIDLSGLNMNFGQIGENFINDIQTRWDQGFKPNLKKAKDNLNLSEKYKDLYVNSLNINNVNAIDKMELTLSIEFLKIIIEIYQAPQEVKLIKIQKFKKIFFDSIKNLTDEVNRENLEQLKTKVKNNAYVEASLIFYNTISAFEPEDFKQETTILSKKAVKAIAEAKKQYLEMTLNPKTKACGYDGLATFELIENKKSNKEAVKYAEKALNIDPTLSNSFSIIVSNDFRNKNYNSIINRAKNKLSKIKSADTFIVRIFAYSFKNDFGLANKVMEESIKLQDQFSDIEKNQLKVAIATKLILENKYEDAFPLLKQAVNSLDKNDSFRDIALYNAAVLHFLKNENDNALACLEELEKSKINDESLVDDCSFLKLEILQKKLWK